MRIDGDDVRPRVLGDAEEATKDLLFSLIASGALRPMAACRVAEWAASLRRRLDTKLDVWWEDGDA